jgi:hypothetical protein
MAEDQEERMELACRETGTHCDFVARGKTIHAIAAWAEHAETIHGTISFPPELWVKMRSRVGTVKT